MTKPNPPCPFCLIASTGQVLKQYEMLGRCVVMRFEPLNPVVEGHMLFVPNAHVEHPNYVPTSHAMYFAARYGEDRGEDFNLITSSGPAATQTVPHLHVHYVPRREGDGLTLPWTGRGERDAEVRRELLLWLDARLDAEELDMAAEHFNVDITWSTRPGDVCTES